MSDDYFNGSYQKIKKMVDDELDNVEKLSKFVKSDRYNTYKKDCKAMVRTRTTRTQIIASYGEECDYINEFFGPVAIRWNDDTNHAETMMAMTRVFMTKEEHDEFLKTEKPLVYVLYRQKFVELTESEKKTSFGPLDTENREKKIKYIVRYFPKVGKLSKLKYYAQFWITKLNPKYFRSFLYRYLVGK